MYQKKKHLSKKKRKQLIKEHISEYERLDYKIMLTVLLLCAYGIVMIYSASSFKCSITAKYNFDSFYFAKKQIIFVIAGVIASGIIARYLNYNWIKPFSKVIYLLGVGSIFLLLTPLGISSYGAVRWIGIGPVSLQVAEVVKIALIVILSGLSCRYARRMSRYKTLLTLWVVGAVPCILLFILSNDLSSAIILAGITFGMTFVVTPWKKLHYSIVLLTVLGVAFFITYFMNNLPSAQELSDQNFRVGRIAAWLNPEAFADGQGYQPLQALYAVAHGGITGTGLGKGVQKLTSIPEAQNDMIFAVICEELGLFGAAILIFLFCYLLYQLFRVAISCKDLFGSSLVTGIILHIALQTLINLSVVLGVIPNTGASLPFISSGGTAVFMTLCEIGLALSVYRRYVERHIIARYEESKEEIKQTEPAQFSRRRTISR